MNEIIKYLKELNFEVDEKKLVFPKLKEVAKRFRELAKVKHSDKGGDDAEFIKLYHAYNQIRKYFKEGKDKNLEKYCEGSEEEEELIKKLFEEFNISQKNKSCFTVFIENDLSLIWGEVLEDIYGEPEDKGINGLHWSHRGYEYKGCEVSDIYLRKYHMPKSDKTSKIVIQGNFELAVAYVANELPKLYKKVYDKKKLPISVVPESDITTQPSLMCKRCELDLPDENEMKKHEKKPHRKCDYCPFQTTKLTTLKPHIEKHHGGAVRCEACDYSSNDVKLLKKHLEDDHFCSKCHKPKGKKISLDCKTCKMPTHIECLKIDIGKERTDQYKSKANEYQCRLCLEKLIGIEVINPTLQNEEYSCQFCELKMKEESELREHEAAHTQQSAINWDICDKVFKTQNDLDAHMTNHAGTSSIKCPICDYKAKTTEEVQVHMNSHDNTGTNVIKGLEESCKKLEEEILIERKSNEKNVSYIQE